MTLDVTSAIATRKVGPGCMTPAQYQAAPMKIVKDGHDAVNVEMDPFLEVGPFGTMCQTGQISPKGERLAYDITAAVWDTVCPHVEILIDAHGDCNVPVAIRTGNILFERSRTGWFEEPLPPESFDALRQVREHCTATPSLRNEPGESAEGVISPAPSNREGQGE